MSNNKRIFATSTEFYNQVSNLNKSFLIKIKEVVDDNSIVNLIPMINDYRKHYNDLEVQSEKVEKKRIKKDTRTLNASTTTPSTSKFNGEKPRVSSSAGGFKFADNSMSKSVSTNNSGDSSTSQKDKSPNMNIPPVQEEDYFYEISCKIFNGMKGKFDEYGAGKLYLIAIRNSDEVQLIVRSDASDSLGKILYHTILSAGISMKKKGTNDVELTCDAESVLFRVESLEKADELLQTLEKHKK